MNYILMVILVDIMSMPFLLKKAIIGKYSFHIVPPEKTGKEELVIIKDLQTQEEIDEYLKKLDVIFAKYARKSMCYCIPDITREINAF